MIVTTEWLSEYVSLAGVSAEDLARRLTAAGLPVEALEGVPGEDGNFRLEIETASNRPDLLGVLGVAREVAAILGRPLSPPKVAEAVPGPAPIPVEVRDGELCPRYTARRIEEVSSGPSPGWMARRLRALGQEPIDVLVDVTNYVMFELGQPLHAFDAERLEGGRIVVRRAEPGEPMRLLDGSELALGPEALVIADAEKPVALAGIMGGAASGVSPETRTVILESARFHPANLRRARRRFGAPETESSRRFEHGVDVVGVELASRRAAELLARLGGGRLAPGVADVWPDRPAPVEVTLRPARLGAVLGAPVEAPEARRALEALGFALESRGRGKPPEDEALVVRVPSHRPDVRREIDLIEEVARIRGYDRIPERIALPARVPAESPRERTLAAARSTLLALGLTEVVSESLVAPARARASGPWSDGAAVELAAPPRRGEGAMRQSLLPSLLAVRKTNQDAGVRICRLFEIGTVYRREPAPAGPSREDLRLAILEDGGFGRLKGAIESLLSRLVPGARSTWREAARPFLAPGAAAEVLLEGDPLGLAGEAAAEAKAALGLKRATFVAELDLEALVPRSEAALAAALRRPRGLPRFPAIERDVALVLAEAVPWGRVEAEAASALPALAERIEFLSLYRGKPVPEGRKSVAFAVRYRHPERTLTDDEIAPVHGEFVASLCRALGATVRGEESGASAEPEGRG